MTTASATQPTAEQVQSSFAKALETEPAYKEILPYFQSVHELQAAAVETTQPAMIDLSPEIINARRTGEMPLIERGEITVDQAASSGLLIAMLNATKSANPQLAAAAKSLKTYIEENAGRLALCQRMFLDKDREGLGRLCENIGISADALDFFLYNSLWPSLAVHSSWLTAMHAPDGDWTKGYCPICGALPGIAFLAENGQRFLVCRFCRHAWPFKRIQCPTCGNQDTDTIGYHISDNDKAHRIDTCDQCKTYILNVDTRQLSRDFYPPLEALVSTHLDIKAEQMGYLRAVDLNYQDLSSGLW